jgi:membrane-associated phospholipid phosphatase
MDDVHDWRDEAVNAGSWLDEHVLRLVVAHRTGWATSGARAMMDAGTSVAVLVVVGVLVVAVVVARRAYRPAVAVALAVVASTAAAGLLKQLVDRARPPADLALVHLGGAAMPSTHAARTAATATAVIVAVTWRSPRARFGWGLVLATITVVIGACLVYLGVHWPTDVVAGWALGVTVGTLAGLLCRSGSRPSQIRAPESG